MGSIGMQARQQCWCESEETARARQAVVNRVLIDHAEEKVGPDTFFVRDLVNYVSGSHHVNMFRNQIFVRMKVS